MQIDTFQQADPRRGRTVTIHVARGQTVETSPGVYEFTLGRAVRIRRMRTTWCVGADLAAEPFHVQWLTPQLYPAVLVDTPRAVAEFNLRDIQTVQTFRVQMFRPPRWFHTRQMAPAWAATGTTVIPTATDGTGAIIAGTIVYPLWSAQPTPGIYDVEKPLPPNATYPGCIAAAANFTLELHLEEIR